ncbi:Uncharacterised protein [Avibacterium paragallinarum]|uniref:Uncharacterized protein n=1 Tax=Avibacterium paragallinarum TaxID=728 RepID=A0A377IDV3_AVIPA|nr:Uncharacterised protein [Avibacterium paragallinarum]
MKKTKNKSAVKKSEISAQKNKRKSRTALS